MWLVGAALFGAVLAGTLAPQSRLWAFHFLGYLSIPGRVAFSVAAALAGIGCWWRSRQAAPQNRGLPARWGWHATLALVLSALGFVLFTSAVAILGDGQLWVNNVEMGAYNFTATRAPLTMLLHHELYRLLHPLTGISGERTFSLVAVLCGLVTLSAWLYLARALKTGVGMTLLFGFSWGGIALFFGYVEAYTVVVAATSWTIVLAYLSVRRGRFSWLPVALGLLAPLLNFLAVVFLPALAAYLYWGLRGRELNPRRVLNLSAAVMAVAAACYFILGWQRGTNVLLPLFATTDTPGALFTWRQWTDLCNTTAFVCGPLLALFALALCTPRSAARNTLLSLLLLTLLFPVAALVIHNPQLGMARDWDISAALFVLVPILAIIFWTELALSPAARRSVQILCILWLALVTAPWIRVQNSNSLALRRFMDLLALDPDRSETGWDYLSSYYLHHGQKEEWGRCNLELLKRWDNPRYHTNLVLYYAFNCNWQEAGKHAGAAARAVMADSTASDWEKGITSPYNLLELGEKYARQSRVSDAASCFAVAAEMAPYSVEPRAALLNLFVFLRDIQRASVVALDLAGRAAPQTAEAREFFRPLTSAPDAYQRTGAWLCLSLIAAAGNDVTTARAHAQSALAISPADTAAQNYLARLKLIPR